MIFICYIFNLCVRHSDVREFLCANCGKQFKRKDKLKEHMKRMHSAERELKTGSLALRILNKKERKFSSEMVNFVIIIIIIKESS